MKITTVGLMCAIAASSAATLMISAPAHALTMQECSAKYSAAKTAGSLGGKTWNDFRKAECGSTDATAPTPTAATKGAEAKPAEAKPSAAPKPAATTAAAPAGPAVFPKTVDAKYAKETAAKQRFKTCVDQYNINKTSNANGGLKWIEKGGGYYSECNKKLKGAA